MHKAILTPEQMELLSLVEGFARRFGLVGGTAVALQIGHRRSLDFDLFTETEFKNQSILNRISRTLKIERVIVNKLDELTIVIKGVKLTFFHYPYKIDYSEKLRSVIKMPNLVTLAAMKAFALGQRSKWKDYVDLYFIIKKYHGIDEIAKKAKQLFGTMFNEKLFRTQLAYFDDINYDEEVEFMPGFEISDELIKKELIEFSLK
jgi:hypothetical protein